MDANAGTPPTDKKCEKLSADRLSSVDEIIDWVVNYYSVGVESPAEAETEVSVSGSLLLPTETPIMGISKPPEGNGGSSEDKNNAKPMTEEEKLQLSRGIAHVYGPYLTQVIDIVRSREPSESNSDGFELALDKLQPSTLRALESYVVSRVGKEFYYKKIAITREQRMEVRRKRKLRKLEKELQGVAVAESSWLSDSNSSSSDSYASLSSRSSMDYNSSEAEREMYGMSDCEVPDQVALATSMGPSVVPPEMLNTKQKPDRFESGLPSVFYPLSHSTKGEKLPSQPLPHPEDKHLRGGPISNLTYCLVCVKPLMRKDG